jgi:hypothetical protein
LPPQKPAAPAVVVSKSKTKAKKEKKATDQESAKDEIILEKKMGALSVGNRASSGASSGSSGSSAVVVVAVVEVVDPGKRLKALKKKLKEIVAIEAKSSSLTPEQVEKMNRKVEIEADILSMEQSL